VRADSALGIVEVGLGDRGTVELVPGLRRQAQRRE
jgi:hypothetical protein